MVIKKTHQLITLKKMQWKPLPSSWIFLPFPSWLKIKTYKKLLATEEALFFYDESLTK